MQRIKDLKDIILRNDTVLLKAVLVKSNIILTDGVNSPQIDYAEVIAVGGESHIKPGMIVLEFDPKTAKQYNLGKENYILISSYNIQFAVTKENFDNNKVLPKGIENN